MTLALFVYRVRHTVRQPHQLRPFGAARVGVVEPAATPTGARGRCDTVAAMSERRPGYDRGDEGRANVAPRDAAICETVQGRHDPGEDTAGWLAALWRALALAYHRDGDQADGCNLATATYEPRPRS